MPHGRRGITITVAIALVLLGRAASIASAEPIQFRVWLDGAAAKEPIAGRLYVFVSQRMRGEPRFGPDWFQPEPFFGLDVATFQPGTSCQIDDRADGFPDKLSRLRPGRYRVQAVLHHDFYSPNPGRGEGNVFGDAVWLDLNPSAGGTIDLVLRHVVPPQPFPPSTWVKEVAVPSELLSEFHGREVIERAAVVLPPSYDHEPGRRYPAVYVVPGFSGSYRGGQWMPLTGPREAEPGEVELIRVMLDGQCHWGHHVYANSETNGPRGDALVRELIPYIDQNYRTVAAPTARFVTGHSSGGWSSLWLQVSYPEVFGGVWSSSPDPVDFRDFQGIDVYANPPQSMYHDEQGNRRPIARRGSQPILWYDSFARMDDCLGRGGQLRSFEAVFSPRGPDGLPRKLWDRTTGRIDPEVARAWRKHDICALLAENWDTLGPQLEGKLHVVVGGLDTFYLEGAVHGLAQTLQQLRSDAQIEFLPGRDHGTVLTPDQWRKRRRQMGEVFLRHHGEDASVGENTAAPRDLILSR
ncbi:MAG TPA: alpha/beta hydrolase-fold protein [Thermoguttaceae bacterium]|nr:alpha/beta hydrolase-fold protein [Thermoguttaceae bacterium]